MQLKLLFTLALLPPLLLGCSDKHKPSKISHAGGGAQEKKTPASKATGFAAMPTIVETATAEKFKWQPQLKSIGSLSAFKGATLSAETAGRVTKVDFTSGLDVKKDQPLITIFPDTLKAELKMAKAALRLSELTYKRDYKLQQGNYVSMETLDQAKSTFDSDRANVQKLKAMLTQNIVKAPFAGRIGLKQVSVGQYLQAGNPIVDLQQLDPLRVEFSVPSSYLSLIKLGDPVSFTVQAYPGQTFAGKIYALNSAIDKATRMLPVRATAPNTKHLLLPGTFVEVTTIFDKPQTVITIPQTAIVYASNSPYVYKETAQHTVKKVDVTLGPRLGDNKIIILKGVQDNDEIIIGGQLKLHPGATVMTKAELADYLMQKSKRKK